MISSREDFLMQILKCGLYDLSLIDRVEYDWRDILDSGVLDADFTLPSVMSAVFGFGIQKIEEAVNNRIGCLTDTRERYGISEEQEDELDSLRKLNPYDDFEEYHNYIDTHVTIVKHQDIYNKYLSDALIEFDDGTGFNIEM